LTFLGVDFARDWSPVDFVERRPNAAGAAHELEQPSDLVQSQELAHFGKIFGPERKLSVEWSGECVENSWGLASKSRRQRHSAPKHATYSTHTGKMHKESNAGRTSLKKGANRRQTGHIF